MQYEETVQIMNILKLDQLISYHDGLFHLAWNDRNEANRAAHKDDLDKKRNILLRDVYEEKAQLESDTVKALIELRKIKVQKLLEEYKEQNDEE